MKRLLIFALAALLIIPALSLAATPQLVSVHGKLTDTLNNPYSGSKNFVLRIYPQESGGSTPYTYRANITDNLAANANASGNAYIGGNVDIGTTKT